MSLPPPGSREVGRRRHPRCWAGYLLGAAGLGLPAGDYLVGVGERALDSDVAVVVRDLRGLTWNGAALWIPEGALPRG